MRKGFQYLESLRDGRSVLLDGQFVTDVSAHPAFRPAAKTIAQLFDIAADPASEMIHVSPDTGRQANKVFMIPRSRQELRERRHAITRWANKSHGFIGRGPDHVGGFLAGFAAMPEVFDTKERQFGANVTRFYQKVADENLYTSYVIIPPQISRASTAHGWPEELLQVGVYKERDDGMIVRGSQMLGTATAISDYVLVSCIKPLTPSDERYAVTFVAPLNARGLRVLCRRPYASGQPSSFDYPLSTRFDETDALVIFDDVFVPWEDVFVYRDVEQLRRQFFETPAHVLGNSQAQIRLISKMKFIVGVARKIARVNGIEAIPSVQEKLGELAGLAAHVEGMVLASEDECVTGKGGTVQPNPRFLYGAMALQAEIYPRAIMLLRELAGGGVLQVPSSIADLISTNTQTDIARYLQSTALSANDRVQLFKLAWDIVGSEFGGRHLQYEMFYAGAPFVAKGYAYRNYGFEETIAAVDEFLHSYSVISTLRDDAASLCPKEE